MSNRDVFLTILAEALSELVPEATIDTNPDVLSRPEPNTIRVVVGEVEDEPDGRLTGTGVKIGLYGDGIDLLPEDAQRSKMMWDRGVVSALEQARAASGTILGVGRRRRGMIRWGEGLGRGQSITMIGGLRAQPYAADVITVLPSHPVVAEVDTGKLENALSGHVVQHGLGMLRAAQDGVQPQGDGTYAVRLRVQPRERSVWLSEATEAALGALNRMGGHAVAGVGRIHSVRAHEYAPPASERLGWGASAPWARIEARVQLADGQHEPLEAEEAVVGGE